jgi:hypothetical protein
MRLLDHQLSGAVLLALDVASGAQLLSISPKLFMNIARRLERMDTILSQVIMKFCRLSQGFSYVPFHRNEPTGLLSGALKRREIISTLLVAHHTLIPFFSIWKSAQ